MRARGWAEITAAIDGASVESAKTVKGLLCGLTMTFCERVLFDLDVDVDLNGITVSWARQGRAVHIHTTVDGGDVTARLHGSGGCLLRGAVSGKRVPDWALAELGVLLGAAA